VSRCPGYADLLPLIANTRRQKVNFCNVRVSLSSFWLGKLVCGSRTIGGANRLRSAYGKCTTYRMVKMLKDVKILLADDDEEVLAALNDVLRSEGYEVIMAKNGRAAIEYFHEGHIDIALLDLNMPIKGGWETFERLTTIHPLLPIIVITARPEQYPLAVAAGVGALMEKPLDLPLLLQTIEELLNEPIEQRLSRLTGKRPITRYLQTQV
jgi:CheY-like chemotaxis protein